MILCNEDLIRDILSGLGRRAIAKKYMRCVGTIQVRTARLRAAGKIPDISNRAIHPPTLSDADLKEMYLSGLGIVAIQNITGLSYSPIHRRLERFKILVNRSQPKSNYPRKQLRRHLSMDFSAITKRERFIEERGICEWCEEKIGDGSNFRAATYHHIKMVCKGGDNSKENCKVLHGECHLRNFYILHGFEYSVLTSSYLQCRVLRQEAV